MTRVPLGHLPETTLNTLNDLESQFDQYIERLEHDLIDVRRHLHAHPEPSGEEVGTSKFVAGRLEAAGLKPRIMRDDIGVIADLDLGRPTPSTPLIAVRADIDALRLPDQKTVDYASKREGVAHACGHDAHTAIVLGTALSAVNVAQSLGESNGEFAARLRFVFQPAEETSQGAAWLVEQGAMDGVNAIIALHVDPERPVGEVGIRYGILTAHCDEIEISVEGHGGHAARPHHTVDPVAAAAHLVSSLYEFLPRSIDSRSPAVLTIGQINGGYAPNVIPERVELHGSLRTTEEAARQRLKQRIAQICAGAEHSSGAGIHVRYQAPLAAVNNDPHVTAALEEACRRVLGPGGVHFIDRPSMGGEDFSVYLDHAPGAMLRLGCSTPNTRPPFLHSTLFDLDERTLTLGTRLLVRAALLLSLGPSE